MLANCPQWNIENVTGLVVAITALAVAIGHIVVAVVGPRMGATFTNGASK